MPCYEKCQTGTLLNIVRTDPDCQCSEQHSIKLEWPVVNMGHLNCLQQKAKQSIINRIFAIKSNINLSNS
jgi:hypothetical protein